MNTEMAQQILDYFSEHPEQHNQEYFFENTSCGSMMCIAGAASHLAGDTALWNDYGMFTGDIRTKLGERLHIAQRGVELLGIDGEDIDALFHEYDNARALRRLQAIADGNSRWFEVK